MDVNKLACDHWSYVQDVIITANPDIDDKVLEQIGFHYRTAFVHGFKHASETHLCCQEQHATEKVALPLYEINTFTNERRLVND